MELSERLVQLAPSGLTRVFYADNGSAGIEVALKMSHHYWRNIGQPQKKRFATISNGYHGETLSTMAVSDIALYTETYQALLMDCIKVPSLTVITAPRARAGKNTAGRCLPACTPRWNSSIMKSRL